MTETQREPVPRVATSEKDTALAFLDFARHCLVKKTEGLDEEQLRRVLVPSGTSLLGLVQHVTDGERWWFGYHVAGDPTWSEVDFSMEVPDDVTRPGAGRLPRGGGRQRGDHGRVSTSTTRWRCSSTASSSRCAGSWPTRPARSPGTRVTPTSCAS